MSEDRNQGEGGTPSDAAADPDERAFGGGADMPPGQPDQPRDGNKELTRDGDDDAAQPAPDRQENPHGDYPNLPGYGG